MDEFVEVLTACWRDDPVSFDGHHFEVPPTMVSPKPLQRPRPRLISGMWSEAGLERTAQSFDGWNPAGLPVAAVKATIDRLQAQRPTTLAPLTVHHRAFAQFPHAPTPAGDVVERLAAEAADAAAAGFDEFIVEHNFWSGIADPAAWVDVPERFAPVIQAAGPPSS